ncbi:MAG TPA: glycosyltransferase WbuB [Ruminococcaceae bacterium]|nr:glycosyltransferase WbuB [Oscillospiraceae bacterium]
MKLLFLTIGNVNDLNLHGIYTDLLKEFKARGIEVYVAAAAQRRTGLAPGVLEQSGIHFLRVATGNLTKCGKIEKGISSLRLGGQFRRAINRHFGGIKFDLILYSTPPIVFNSIIKSLKKRTGAASYLLLKDIFPQNAVDLGYFGGRSLIYKYFRKKETGLYKVSDYIGCMSPANREYLLSRNKRLDPSRVEVCPNALTPRPKINSDRKATLSKYGIPHEPMILIYGGNLGRPQGLGFLSEILLRHKNREDIFFVIVGSGTEYKKIERDISDSGVKNAVLLRQMEEREYAALLSACDIGLLFLDARFTVPNFPSRLLAYFEQELPVLAATDTSTDIRQVLEQSGAGIWVRSGDFSAFDGAVQRLAADKERRLTMGAAGRRLLENEYTSEICCDKILGHLDVMEAK